MANKKVYIVRKFVFADSILDAYQKEKKIAPDDVYLEDNSMKTHIDNISKEVNETGYGK